MAITGLRTEYANNPLGLDCRRPRLSWRVDEPNYQDSFRVIVDTAEEKVRAGEGGAWDTGRKTSGATHADYAGTPLEPTTRYFWAVEGWSERGVELGPAFGWWETGLGNPSRWCAKWIGSSAVVEAPPVLRKEFPLRGPVRRARAYICGLGYYELYINGSRVGERVLDSPFTDYSRRVLYSTYDVADVLQPATAVGVALGRGWYAFSPESFFDWPRTTWRDEPKVILQISIEYEDGSSEDIVSDGAWRLTHNGPTRRDSVFGEIYDARLAHPGWATVGFDDADWYPATVVRPPAGELTAQEHEPIEVITTLEPIASIDLGAGGMRFDFGKNVSGWAAITVAGDPGAAVQLRYAEKPADFSAARTYDEGAAKLCSASPSPGAEFQRDMYVLAGSGRERWEPRFSYKGFRWVDVRPVTGAAVVEAAQARVVHSAIPVSGAFAASNPLLTNIHELFVRAMLNNLHGLPTDTPVYEKAGWTGDAMLTMRSALYALNGVRLYKKFARDMLDAQLENGEVPPFVPSSGWGYVGRGGGSELNYDKGPTPDFDAAYMVIPWELYRNFGDERVLHEHYESMVRYLGFVEKFAEDHVLRWGIGDYKKPGCMDEGGAGENSPPLEPHISPGLVATAWYYRMSAIASEVATILGHPTEAEAHRDLASRIASAFDDAFYDQDAGVYSTRPGVEYSQTSNALPLALGLVPSDRAPDVAKSLVADIEARDWHLNTGIQGTRVLLPVLTNAGYVDAAYALAAQTTEPSWGAWVSRGATACWERWDEGARSHSHHFFGSVVEWFYEYLAGISPGGPGFDPIHIKPRIPESLEWVRASIETSRGRVASGWTKESSGRLSFDIEVPGNSTADVTLPGLATFTLGPGVHRLAT